MKFGAIVATKIDDWQLLRYAEELGYDHGWVPDSQMIWSDCYATLALAAEHTSRIKLGTGVSIAPTRLAPVTAHSIASINRIAPGRVFLGIGTGYTAMNVMGMKPMSGRAFGEYVRVVRALLHGKEVEYTFGEQTRDIRFLHTDLGFLDLEHPIPIYVAADGPLALAAAGAYGDGRISSGESNRQLERSLASIHEGAEAAGRDLPNDFHTAELTFACVLQPGEDLTSERVIDEVGSMVAVWLHGCYEVYMRRGTDEFVRPEAIEEWRAYRDYVENMDVERHKLHQRLHEGHCTYLVPEERRFITPNTIRAARGLVGEPDEIIEMLREKERHGLKEVTLLPPMAHARENFKAFAEQVMTRY